MAQPLTPNRIHQLPVQVSYHLQSSSQTFLATFPGLYQVYVHPNVGSRVDGTEDEAWGAIYLKTVVQGVVMASPEIHPTHPGTPDLSLYVLDPRETFLRKSRAAPAHRFAPHSEVWTGKGLMSWALGEPGAGKSLITGRLVRRSEFVGLGAGLSGLEALAAANGQDDAWGIEVAIGLKSGMSSASMFPGPLHYAVESGMFSGVLPAAPPRQPTPPLPTSDAPLAPTSDIPSDTEPRSVPAKRPLPKSTGGRPRGRPPKQPKRGPAVTQRERLGALDSNQAAARSSPTGHPADHFFASIPPELRPDHMSKEHAQKLLQSPAFLRMLEKITGTPMLPLAQESSKSQEPAAVPKCWNCGTIKSTVWRTRNNDEGESVRVCNACGLYYNKTKMMRPPNLWSSVGEDKALLPAQSSTFKRTLTMVAEKDAQRIASMRATRSRVAATAKLPAVPRAMPMTSPPRGPASLPKSVRNAKFAGATAVAASSPGGWVEAGPSSCPPSGPADENTIDPNASPNTNLRRIFGDAMPSLAMPLSDDGAGTAESHTGWNADLSAFFDVDGFSMAPGTAHKSIAKSPALRSQADIKGVSSALRGRDMDAVAPTSMAASSEDDVFSQLFQRTSSVGDLDASDLGTSDSPFDFSQLPPSSPPSMPSNLPHSALLLSSPGGSPMDISPRPDSEAGSRVSPPALSGLRHSVHADDADLDQKPTIAAGDQEIQDLLSKLASGGKMSDELLALFNAFPAASAT
ncbi:hypothetical protein Q8F55_002585 [Vanrija albida]|uniref:GATA-type domain-containing protein n=1 Tax=Vanrija albida TaxID=181172 RepID=A0ABR3QAB4_9TREE